MDSALKVDVINRRIITNSIPMRELISLISIRFRIYMPREKKKRESSSLFSQAEFRIAVDLR